jgi:hypothetical protein
MFGLRDAAFASDLAYPGFTPSSLGCEVRKRSPGARTWFAHHVAGASIPATAEDAQRAHRCRLPSFLVSDQCSPSTVREQHRIGT